MYQTVGHQVIPLYAEATGIPLYRRAIVGGATQHDKDYSHYEPSRPPGTKTGHRDGDGAPDETESMVPLLEAVKAAHSEANALCAGAILSTYQRTRVESVAIRLGLTPLAYLWKFPLLPTPPLSDPAMGADAQLLDDMAAAGLEARIVKVASGGLDDSFLWTNVASPEGKARIARAMRRFGPAESGAVIGEGGEFETLVVDGPSALFRKRIVVAQEDRHVVREGGGSAWLRLQNVRLEDKGLGDDRNETSAVRIPDLLDAKFARVLDVLSSPARDESKPFAAQSSTEIPPIGSLQAHASRKLQHWSFVGRNFDSVTTETQSIVEQIRRRLCQHSLPSSAILSATIVLRRMADFPAINAVYGALFDAPNPPSRVTISCGDALSAAADAGAKIVVYLSVMHTTAAAASSSPLRHRRGLHVQSRSYWAPANIGPYSQAISIPVASLASSSCCCCSTAEADTDAGTRLVTVAGQIPLVPASMALPSPADIIKGTSASELQLQLVLALQHLWRIGAEMGVQWWTSAVAYFPRLVPQPDDAAAAGMEMELEMEMQARAMLAARAWQTAHAATLASSNKGDSGEETEEEEDEGPDLWDRRFNPQYRSYYQGGEQPQQHEPSLAGESLPDRRVLAPAEGAKTAVLPPLFVAEVDELPRGAGVEWHAHFGVAHADPGSVFVRDDVRVSSNPGGREEEEEGQATVSQVIVTTAAGVSFVQTVVAHRFNGDDYEVRGKKSRDYRQMAGAALAQLGVVPGDVSSASEEPAAAVLARYVDARVLSIDQAGEEGRKNGETRLGPVVPCRSLWDAKGERLASVTVYQSVFERSHAIIEKGSDM
jgi:diphthine-ammonia ligase